VKKGRLNALDIPVGWSVGDGVAQDLSLKTRGTSYNDVGIFRKKNSLSQATDMQKVLYRYDE